MNKKQLSQFIEKYNRWYNWLCKNESKPNVKSGLAMLEEWFDDDVRENPELYKAFCQTRGDICASDRELAAYALAYPSFDLWESFVKS